MKYCPCEYPPTHQYNWRMKPKGPLRERLSIIATEFPWFFTGKRLLDIACSFGYFSLTNHGKFQEITGIDVNKESIDWCNKHNKYANVTFQNTTFREYASHIGFDRIFVGNVAHHLFMDCGGTWDWLAKLYALSTGYVLLEGATSTACKDMRDIIPAELHETFNGFEAAVSKYFTLEKKVPTTEYTPDRYLMLYAKKRKPTVDLKDLVFKKTYSVHDFWTFLTQNNYIAKVYLRDPTAYQIWNGSTRIRLACESPITNGMFGEIHVDGNMVGWLEQKLPGKPYRYFENEIELWNKLCNHNIFLAKNGYVDLDSGTINFNKKTGLLFDKSSIFPIKHLRDESIDFYPKLFNQSYNSLSSDIPERVVVAVKTRDSKVVEKTFRELKQ